MASSDSAGGSLPPNFFLTPHQQGLLFAALNANNPHHDTSSPTTKGLSLSARSSHSSPMQLTAEGGASIQESPYLDNYEYDFGDTSFDFSFASAGADGAKVTADAPGTANSDSAEGEAPEKRSHPDDGEDDSSPGNDIKRRESAEKVAKKPGRKPLTSEPTSKRKAQNRAAQRAFRERKEKHLKDLETKVEELEKASEAANHENSKLRAKVEHMTTELTQYKQRLAVMMHKPASREKTLFGDAALNNLGDVNFQFEFPKFGALPGPPIDIMQSTSQPVSPQQSGRNGQKKSSVSSLDSEKELSRPPQQQQQQQHQSQTGPFFNSASASTRSTSGSTGIGSRSSLDSVPFSIAAATSSPSASSNSNAGGPSSSCGTSPEPFTQSPAAFKPLETLTTIGEEQVAPATTLQQPSFPPLAHANISSTSFDWLVQQNGGGSFDPQLFGDYREPQESVLSNPSFDDFVFNDSSDADFFTPFNTAPTNYPTNPMAKKNLIAEIDAQQDAIENDEAKPPGLSCHQLWEKIQECPKAQNGDFDLDGLCSELTKKARCSGSGPVIAPGDFDSILKKFMGKVSRADCMPNQAGLAVKPDELGEAGVGMSSRGVV